MAFLCRLATPSPTFENADRYVEAKTLVENLTSVVAALDDAGGVAAIRDKILARSHATPHFNRGFQSRLAALEKLIALARKRLGARIGELTEANVLAGLIEADHVVSATRGFIAGVNVQLETARSCLAEGAPGNRAARSFDQKFAILTSALPVPPAST